MLDNTCAVDTPEGIELHLQPAGPVARSLAWLLDMLIRAVIYGATAMLLGLLGAFGIGLFLILAFVLEWFYPVWFEVYRDGVTPGKKALGLRVVGVDGTPVGWSASMVRNLLRVADFLPFAYGFGLISVLFTQRLQRLGDLAANTLVVHVPRSASVEALPAATPQQTQITLTPEEAQSVIAFAERSAQLNAERAKELAELALPLGDKGVPPTPARLHGVAAWLTGQQS